MIENTLSRSSYGGGGGAGGRLLGVPWTEFTGIYDGLYCANRDGRDSRDGRRGDLGKVGETCQISLEMVRRYGIYHGISFFEVTESEKRGATMVRMALPV